MDMLAIAGLVILVAFFVSEWLATGLFKLLF